MLPVFGAILISVLPVQSPWIRRVAIATTVLVMFHAVSFFFVFALAGMGVPGINGFNAENLILISALESHTGAGKNDVVAETMDLGTRELLLVVILIGMIITGGIFTNIVLDFTRSASEKWTLY